MHTYDHDDDRDTGEERPSKSQIKREMTALQDLGEELVALSRDQLARMALPDDLLDAVRDAQRFTKHEARRRQMQYIGRVMRDIDAAPIRAAIDEIKGISAAATARQHALERLRTRLMADESAFAEIAAAHPGADIQRLRQLRRNALREQEHNKPPRAYRELFRALRELQQGDQAGDENHDEDFDEHRDE